ncbi:MAG: DUF2783 domain-containing protein [Pseudomonadota bacterium]
MAQLNLKLGISRPDDLYQQIIGMHQGLSDEASTKLNAKLILLLINHIGDPQVVAEAISIAACDKRGAKI